MEEQKKSVYQSLRQLLGDFVLTIALFLKSVVTALLLAWIVSLVPFVAHQMGIAGNNPAAQVIMIAGDITSVIIAIMKLLEDLELAFRR